MQKLPAAIDVEEADCRFYNNIICQLCWGVFSVGETQGRRLFCIYIVCARASKTIISGLRSHSHTSSHKGTVLACLSEVTRVKTKQRRRKKFCIMSVLVLAVGSALTFTPAGSLVHWCATEGRRGEDWGGNIALQTVKEPSRRQLSSSRARGDPHPPPPPPTAQAYLEGNRLTLRRAKHSLDS